MRNMAFTLTVDQMRARTKRVTRRVGWEFLIGHTNQFVRAIEKGQGLKKGEHVVPLYVIRILSASAEPLNRLIREPAYGRREMVLEGFPGRAPADFVNFFCAGHGCLSHHLVTRIEFEEHFA